jgi:hypothetical protein
MKYSISWLKFNFSKDDVQKKDFMQNLVLLIMKNQLSFVIYGECPVQMSSFTFWYLNCLPFWKIILSKRVKS